jgi:hypothetical protein
LFAHEPDAETDPVAAALVDDQQREFAGYTRRDWRALTLEQKAAAVGAGTKRWR